MSNKLENALNNICWNHDGLIPAIVQDHDSNEVLMLAWMNANSLRLTLTERRGVYWSRSRKQIWRKGETSGNIQSVCEVRLDCDKDTILLRVAQKGGACHTGRKHCFFYILDNENITVDLSIKKSL